MTQSPDRNGSETAKDGRVARGEITRDRVLDAAERCFAERGFDAVSVREIAREAGVTLGTVSFHSGGKSALFRAVLTRRMVVLNDRRMDRLQAVQANSEFRLGNLVDAYVTPFLEIASGKDPQWRAYARVVARVAADDRYFVANGPLFDPVAMAFLTEMNTLYPRTDPKILAVGFSLVVSSMLGTVARSGRVFGVGDVPAPDALHAFREQLVNFCVGGLLRMLDPE